MSYSVCSTKNNSNPAALGSSVHDTAALSGQVGSFSFNSTATVTYAFFMIIGASGTPLISTLSLHDALPIFPDSSATGALAAGDYSYQATYNGNSNYAAKTGDCE